MGWGGEDGAWRERNQVISWPFHRLEKAIWRVEAGRGDPGKPLRPQLMLANPVAGPAHMEETQSLSLDSFTVQSQDREAVHPDSPGPVVVKNL